MALEDGRRTLEVAATAHEAVVVTELAIHLSLAIQ